MYMPKPGPGHKRLEEMAGNWEGEEKMHPSQWDPKGGVATGRTRSKVALGGFALVGDYEQEREDSITFTGHSVMTYDDKENLYSLHWFDCMGSPPEVFQGKFDEDVLTMGHGGPGMHARMTWDLSKRRQMKTKMEMSEGGNSWNTLFEAHYRRA
jgi:hypothetical protein